MPNRMVLTWPINGNTIPLILASAISMANASKMHFNNSNGYIKPRT